MKSKFAFATVLALIGLAGIAASLPEIAPEQIDASISAAALAVIGAALILVACGIAGVFRIIKGG